MNSSAKSGAGAAVAIVIALLSWAIWQGPERKPDLASEPAPATDIATAAEPAAAPEPVAPAPQKAPEPAPAPIPPEIDVLRVAPDGMTTLAGRAAPGATIAILLDGAEVASAPADGSGQFASLFTIPPSEVARLLSLVATLGDGTVLAGTESVAIAPIAVPLADVASSADSETAAAAEPATAPAAIKITEAGAAVLQPETVPAADLAAEVSLDVISYTESGAVQFGGTGSPGAPLVLYLDNAQLAATQVAADGSWSLISGDVAPGVYTLRIDQLDAGGAVTSRLETPFKRETLDALAAASAPPTEPAATPEPAPKVAAIDAEPADAAPAPEVSAADPAAPAPSQSAADAPAAPANHAATATTATAPEAPAQVDATEPAPAASAAPITITVQPGFTLWAIARDTMGDGIMYVQVFEANLDKIKDPDLIYPGQVLSVPASP